MTNFPFQKVIIVGSTGSGKSTLAKQISEIGNFNYIELDSLYWLPDWTHRNNDEFLGLVNQAISESRWVADGNYRVSREMIWKQADTLIWLDYSFVVIFSQLWKRTWRRWWKKELLWGKNQERLLPHLKFWSTKESLFAWLISTYRLRKIEYASLISSEDFKHLRVIHLKNREETRQWIQSIR